MTNVDIISGDLIKSAVARRIKEVLPDMTNIFKEPQPPSGTINTEAIYINQRRVTDRGQFNNLWTRDYELIVRFEPIVTSHKRFERGAAVAEELLQGLQIIDLGYSKVRGRNISYEFSDEVLQLYVTYSIRIMFKEDGGEPMNELSINREVL